MNRLLYITAFFLPALFMCSPSFNILGPAETARGETEAPEEKTERKYVSEDGIVHLQREMDIVDLIKAVSEINEEIYLIEDSIRPKEVSIITPEAGMQKEEVLRLFEIILSMNGLAIIKVEGINKVINAADIKQEGTPVEDGN